jgi:hypothetical protein
LYDYKNGVQALNTPELRQKIEEGGRKKSENKSEIKQDKQS